MNRDDFFGVNHEDLDKNLFIDRINLWFKGNANIRFSPEEQVWVDRAAKTETFDEVVQLAIDLYAEQRRLKMIKRMKSSDTALAKERLMVISDMDIEWDMQPSEKGENSTNNNNSKYLWTQINLKHQ